MFSNEDVAAFMNRTFEPVWESVRPVPIIRIDFGNGTVLTRTLHGNIATYLCTADGQVLDILPGIYEAATYRDRLDQFRLLANYVDQQTVDQRPTRLREFHEGQARALEKNQQPPRLVNMADFSKRRIEGGVKAVLVPAGTTAPAAKAAATGKTGQAAKLAGPDAPLWTALAADTEQNETIRRRQIHQHLAQAGLVQPDKLSRWLYKEVLHADLDDPYLGLGNTLFANYPFASEDRAN